MDEKVKTTVEFHQVNCDFSKLPFKFLLLQSQVNVANLIKIQ